MNRQALKAAIALKNQMRQVCRTDLLKLCNEVLNFKDVCREVHGPILDSLQKFPGGKDVEVSPGKWQYTPHKKLWQLEGPRQNVFLYPRSHLKSTIISIAHAIQWIINYPDIRICISCAIGDQIELIVGSLLKQFRFNPNLRALFPELCPRAERAMDWGNSEQFTVPGRTDLTLKEPTVWSSTVGKVNASFRADVTKHSDLVNEINVKTPGGIKEVINHFGHFNPIVERYSARDGVPATRGWQDVEGTRYDFGDLYGVLLKSPDWNAVQRSAIVSGEVSDKDCTCAELAGKHQKWQHCKTLWPGRFPASELLKILKDPAVGPWIFSSQYLNRCVATGDGLCDPNDVGFIPADILKRLLPRLRLHVTIDLHGMEQNKSNDWTAMTLAGFDGNGRMYIVEIKLGRFTPGEAITNILDLHKRYPQIIDFKVEKEAHAKVLLPFLKREMTRQQRFPVIWPIPRDTQVSKKHRIRGLKPWFATHIIVFSDDLELHVKQELLDEIAQFPSESAGVHDDILDTLADQLQNTEGGVTDDVIPDSPDMKFAMFNQPRPPDRFLGFSESGVAQWLFGDDPDLSHGPRQITGFLN